MTSSDTYRWLSKCSAHKERIGEIKRKREIKRKGEIKRERDKERER